MKYVKLTTEQFIERARIAHGDIYDYSLVDYKGSYIKINIICPHHGVFEQKACYHIQGNGCHYCSKNKKLTVSEFLQRANRKHDNRYTYDLPKYNNTRSKIGIFCPKHGLFAQVAQDHLRETGCPKCRTSKGERDIRIFLQENNIKFQEQKSFDECRYIDKLRFDFYIPDYNILLEYQGEQHFVFSKIFHKDLDHFKVCKKRDNIKNSGH